MRICDCSSDVCSADLPAAVAEGVAVGPRGGRAGGGAHVREEQPGADLIGEAAQVRIVPGRQDLTVEPWLRALAVPADAEAVAIGRALRLGGAEALLPHGMDRPTDQIAKKPRSAGTGQPAARTNPGTGKD